MSVAYRIEPSPNHALFVTSLKGWDPDNVYEAAGHVEELMNHPGWVIVQKLLDGARDTVIAQMVGGKIFDQATYARMTGRANGLEQAKSAAEAVLVRQQQLSDAARSEHGSE